MTRPRTLILLAVPALAACLFAALLASRHADPHAPGPGPADRPLIQHAARVASPGPASGLPTAPQVSVLFSPGGGCEARAVAEIDGAKDQIRVQAYAFTSRPIADALARAHARGVDVAVLLDKRENAGPNGQAGRDLAGEGVAVAYDSAHPISHNKTVVVDGLTVIGGSYNYSIQAGHNAENMTIIRDAPTARLYLSNWATHAGHSGPITPVPTGVAR